MSAATPPPPELPGRGLLAIMATVLHFALVVFSFGMLSLVLDRDVIGEPDAGYFVGPAMVVTACAITFRFVFRGDGERLAGPALSAGLAVLLGSPAVGAIVYAIVRERVGVIPVFFGTHLIDPFVAASAIISAALVASVALLRRRPGPPQLPHD
ncbi:DUF6121 family protein [Marisediminicola senii]|uniref:DUF6121 family protein n=1 Tax=Marisediminicola senii TaxID=2711233 RepID=UPI0013E9A13B|nr:DUF6121 family protein [Marisediminicola senii]